MSKKSRYVIAWVFVVISILLFAYLTNWSAQAPNNGLTGTKAVVADIGDGVAWSLALISSFMFARNNLLNWLHKTHSIIYRWSAIAGLSAIYFFIIGFCMVMIGFINNFGANL